MLKISKIGILFAPLLMIACTSVPPQQQNNQPQPPVIVMEQTSQSIIAPKAVLSLIARSQQQVKQADLNGAKTSLERALRITPRYPDSYYYLAKVNYLQGQYIQARSMAKKSLSLGAQGSLLESILRLLDDIHESERQ